MMDFVSGDVVRHKKTGGIYTILFVAVLEKTLDRMVVYVQGNYRWIRPEEEFCDGRFELVERSWRKPTEVLRDRHDETRTAEGKIDPRERAHGNTRG
jgi:hypothetical protein